MKRPPRTSIGFPLPERCISRREIIQGATGGVGAAIMAGSLGAVTVPAVRPALASTNRTDTGTTLTLAISRSADVTLDPHRAPNDMFYFNLYDYLYGGLVKFDKDARVIPDLAERWDVSPDGLVYTFHLRNGARFGNGRAVISADFVYSWKRALDPKNPSPTSSFLESVVGYEEFTAGQATELTGVRANDDQSVEVTLSQPINYFLSYLATYNCFAVDRELIEKYGDSSNSDWANHQPYGTGAWKVSSFDPATGIEMVPNDAYWGGHSPSVTKLEWPILKGPTAQTQALNLYKTDQADIVSAFPLSLLDAVEKDFGDQQIVTVTAAATSSVAMSFTKPPFDNILVRRAFAMAIDRETYCSVIWRGRFVPTEAFTPPTTVGYQAPSGIAYDPDEAKRVLAAAGFPEGKGLPLVTLYVAADLAPEDANRYSALADMWRTALNANVEVNTSLTFAQIDQKFADEKGLQLYIANWTSITETPQLLSEVFRIDSVYMKDSFDWGVPVPKLTYAGTEYDPATDAKQADALLAQADIEQNPTQRNSLYQQAEALILKNAVYVPVGNFVMRELVKPRVQGLEWGGFFHLYPRSITENVVIAD